jgi:hypothetical protein
MTSNIILYRILEHINKENKLHIFFDIKPENIENVSEIVSAHLKSLSENEQKKIITAFEKDKFKWEEEIEILLLKLSSIINKDLSNFFEPALQDSYFEIMPHDLKIKTNSRISNYIIINKKKKKFQLIYGNYGKWNGKLFFSNVYNISKILDLTLIQNDKTITKTSNNIGKIIASGLLFGPIGAIVGAIDKGGTSKIFNQKSFVLRFNLNDIDLAVVDLNCETSEIAERVINTIKLIKTAK